jgi:hypothetical protein
MKKNVLISLVLVLVPVGRVCAAKGHGAGALVNEALAPSKDVLSIGSDGIRLFYFCDGQEVVIQKCEKEIAIKTRSDCLNKEGGKPLERRVARKTFEAAILSQVTIENAKRLQPLDAEDIKLFSANNGATVIARKRNEEMLLKQIKEVEDYLSQLGKVKNSVKEQELENLKNELSQIRKDFEMGKNIEAAVNNINKELGKLTHLVCDKERIEVVGNKGDENSFMASVLDQFSPRFPCGINGTIGQRILSCSTDKLDGKFVLVAREVAKGQKNKEFWLDKSKTGDSLVWGPAADKKMNFEDAKTYCAGLNDLGLKWELPTINHYLKALDNPEQGKNREDGFQYNDNIRGALWDMGNNDYWTSVPNRNSPKLAWFFDGGYGHINDVGDRDENNSVRCVSRSVR